MLTTRRALLLLATLAGAGLVACGSDEGESLTSLTADEIFEKTKAAVSAAKSVHAAGYTINRGTTVTLDLQVSESGSTGTLIAEGSTLEMLFVGEAFFMKTGKESWTALTGNAAAGEMLGGRYVRVPATEEFADLREFVDWDVFVDEEVMQEGFTAKGETKAINGEEAIALSDTQSGWTLWIPVEGEPLPLQVVDVGGNTIEFRDWGKPVTAETPPADQVIDLSAVAS
jgi:hypothetical protein